MSKSQIYFYGNTTQTLNVHMPVCMDYENQVADYLKTRFKDDEYPFAKSVEDDYVQAIIDAEPVVHSRPRMAELPPVGINEYIFPTGVSRFGRGLFLVDKANIQTMVLAAWDITWDGTGDWPATQRSMRPLNLAMNDAADDEWTTQVWMLPPIQVDSSVTTRQLWIVPVVDYRYHLLYETFDPYDVPTSNDSAVDSTTTWQQLIDAINHQLPQTINSLTAPINAAYLQPDPGYFSARRSLAYAIDHIAHSIGMRAVLEEKVAGYGRSDITFQAASEAAADLTTWPESLIFGTEDNAPASEAEYLTLSHRRLNDHYDNETWDDKRVQNPSPTAPITSEEEHVVSTFFLEFYDEVVDSASETARDSLAEQIRSDHAAWDAYSYNFTIAGVPDASRQLESNGFTDYMHVKLDCSNSIPEVMTTYQTRKPNQHPIVNLSQSPGLYRHPQELARIILNSSGIPQGATEGTGEIIDLDTPYNGTPNPVAVHLNAAASQAIPGGSTLSCYYQSEDGWFVVQGEPGPAGSGQTPWIRFRAKNPVGYQRSGIWNVIVTQVRNGDGSAVAVDDEIEVHDPNNLFADVVFSAYQTVTNCFGDEYIGGSTGTAYLRTPATSDNNPEEVTRWEVETCSRSIDQMDVYLEDCMKADAPDGTTWTGWGHFDQTDQWIRSAYPAVDFPPEVVDDGDESEGYCWKIPIENPYRLTALSGSRLRIRRDTHKSVSSLPTNVTTPHNGGVNSNSEKWIVESVYEIRNDDHGQFARFVHVRKGGTWDGFELVRYWHGQDPTAPTVLGDCEPTISCSLLAGCDCLEDGDDAFAVFDETTHEYHIVATNSAMLGPPDDLAIMNSFAGDLGCTFSFAEQNIKAFACGSQPTVGSASLQTVTQRVVSDAFRLGNDICFNTWDIEVCSTAYVEAECVNICAECDCDEHICAYQYTQGEGWAAVKTCPPEYDDCCCTGNMPTNTPAPGEPTYVTFPCGPCGTECVECDSCLDNCPYGYEFSIADISGTLTNGDRVEFVQGSDVWTSSQNDCCQNLSIQMTNPLSGATQTVTAEVCLINPSNIMQCAQNNRAALTFTWSAPVVLGMTMPTEIGADVPNSCQATYGNNQGCGIEPDFPDQGGGSSWDTVTFGVTCCDVEGRAGGNEAAVLASMGVHTVGSTFHNAELNAPPPEPKTAAKPQGWGDAFVAEYPALFKGCGCKKDVVPVISRWEHREGEPTDRQLELIASTLYSKQKRAFQQSTSVEAIATNLRDFTNRMRANG